MGMFSKSYNSTIGRDVARVGVKLNIPVSDLKFPANELVGEMESRCFQTMEQLKSPATPGTVLSVESVSLSPFCTPEQPVFSKFVLSYDGRPIYTSELKVHSETCNVQLTNGGPVLAEQALGWTDLLDNGKGKLYPFTDDHPTFPPFTKLWSPDGMISTNTVASDWLNRTWNQFRVCCGSSTPLGPASGIPVSEECLKLVEKQFTNEIEKQLSAAVPVDADFDVSKFEISPVVEDAKLPFVSMGQLYLKFVVTRPLQPYVSKQEAEKKNSKSSKSWFSK
eukprot:TRINITY_DN1599_c0_g1_i1.p1 TRINITY_DN1599_c0_g1~~TRINITY_DN1599_c0_g1_i1.p1  ORF type:complete len:299 (+),score=46.05 TRINITY_DN1599_c0_g1_i1:61-897(+)